MLREHCFNIIGIVFNLFENTYKNIYNITPTYNDVKINITNNVKDLMYNNFLNINKKHIPSFLFNDWISFINQLKHTKFVKYLFIPK